MDNQNHGHTDDRLLRLREVEAATGLKRSTIYQRGRDGTFPKPIALGTRTTAWSNREVQAWIANLKPVGTAIAGRAPVRHIWAPGSDSVNDSEQW